MKRIFNFLLIPLIMTAGFLTSCEKDRIKTDDAEKLRGELISYDDVQSYSVEEIVEMIRSSSDGANSEEAAVLDKMCDNFLSRCKAVTDSLETELGANGISYFYNICIYSYWSIDQYGKPIALSAMAAWPYYWCFGYHDYDPDDVLLVEHYTISDDDDAPSKSFSTQSSSILMSDEDLVIAPDLIGFGATKDSVHLYLNHDLTAINSIDALRAGIDMFNKHKRDNTKLEDDWGLYVTGVSQGGASALAVHKYLDTHPSEAEKYHFRASLCCSGPYSPSATIGHYIDSNKGLEYPFVIPMTLKSMMASYPDLLGNKYSESDFYTDAYNAKAKSDVDKMFRQKNVSNADISNKIAEKLGLSVDNVKISDIFNEDALNPDSQLNKDMMTALKMNDITSGWTPKHKMYLVHGMDDQVVPFMNSLKAKINFGDDKCFLLAPGFTDGHESACMGFMSQVALTGPRGFVEDAEEYESGDWFF